jgi:hypothetical protein
LTAEEETRYAKDFSRTYYAEIIPRTPTAPPLGRAFIRPWSSASGSHHEELHSSAFPIGERPDVAVVLLLGGDEESRCQM